MQKVKNDLNSKIKKEKTKAKKGEISIRDKKNGKEARVTLQLGIKGIKNPRIERYGETEKIAIDKIKEVELSILIEVKKFMKRTNGEFSTPEGIKELQEFNEYIDKIVKQCQNFNIKVKKESNDGNKISSVSNNYLVSTYVYQMILNKKKQSEENSIKKKKKISPKTVTFYWNIAKKQVIPLFGNMDVRNITTENIQDVLDQLDYSPKYLIDIRLVLKLSLDLVLDQKIDLIIQQKK